MYKIKDNVTEEMLRQVGFTITAQNLIGSSKYRWKAATRATKDSNVELFFMFDTNYEPYKEYERILEDNFGETTDLTPYIQDLIAKDLVELKGEENE